MKKRIAIILTLVLLFTCVFTACGEKPAAIQQAPYEEYDLTKYVQLPDYMSYKMDKVKVTVSDEDIKEAMDEMLEQYPNTEYITDGKVTKGDVITISFEGKLADGTSVAGMKSDSFEMTLGETSMISGFSEAIYDQKIGETLTANCHFPTPYITNESLSGKDAVFTIVVKNKIVKTLAEFNDEFVKAHSAYQTVDAWKKAAAEYIQEELEDEEYDKKLTELLTKVSEEAKVIELPEAAVAKEKELLDRYMKTGAKVEQMSWEDYLKEAGYESEDEYNKALEDTAKNDVQYDIIIFALVQKEKIDVTADDFATYKESLLKYMGTTESEFETSYGFTLEEYMHINGIEAQIWGGLVLSNIYDRIAK